MLISKEEYERLAKIEVPIWMDITRPDGENIVVHTERINRGTIKEIRDFMKGK